jgi:hypothetical protein
MRDIRDYLLVHSSKTHQCLQTERQNVVQLQQGVEKRDLGGQSLGLLEGVVRILPVVVIAFDRRLEVESAGVVRIAVQDLTWKKNGL